MRLEICDEQNAQLITLMKALYKEDPGDQPMTPEKATATLEHLRHHPDRGRIVSLRWGEECVGYLLLLWYWSNEYGGLLAVVDELYICPQWRRRGFARDVLKWVESQPGIQGVMLEVTPDNIRACNLYRRSGFHRDKNQHFFKWLANDPAH